MLATTEKLIEKNLKDQPFKDWQLVTLLDGTDASRYAKVNKALKKGEIQQLYRGMYILGPKYRSSSMSKYFVASQLVANSYISFETALSYHGWIPEKVTVIMSAITNKRTKKYNTPIGEFSYFNIPSNEYEFLTGVNRLEIDHKPFFMATPLRALADYIYIHKVKIKFLEFLLESLRIEKHDLQQLTPQDFLELKMVYRSKNVLSFLKQLEKELKL